MKPQALPTSVFLATLIGAIHAYLLTWAWAYIALCTPLPHWLISHGFTGTSFRGVLFSTDFLINMLLCVPAAYLLCKLRPDKLWTYLVAAILPGVLWEYRLAFVDITLFSNWKLFLPGVIHAVLPLPVTAMLIRRFVMGAPNNSFRPTPLRGAA